jgi:Calcium-dependent channel, 7TM region, putative phosphate
VHKSRPSHGQYYYYYYSERHSMPRTLPSATVGLVLKIFLALLPMLLTFMNKKAGMQSLAEIDYGVFTKFFIFQVCHQHQ